MNDTRKLFSHTANCQHLSASILFLKNSFSTPKSHVFCYSFGCKTIANRCPITTEWNSSLKLCEAIASDELLTCFGSFFRESSLLALTGLNLNPKPHNSKPETFGEWRNEEKKSKKMILAQTCVRLLSKNCDSPRFYSVTMKLRFELPLFALFWSCVSYWKSNDSETLKVRFIPAISEHFLSSLQQLHSWTL